MDEKPLYDRQLLSSLFRQEYLKMIAVLCRYFGLAHIETAEDVIGETFLKASQSWAIQGVPDNPAAWLYTVAKNTAKDHLKRVALFDRKIAGYIKTNAAAAEPDFELERAYIEDTKLSMIFAVCDPGNGTESQICLALQILCGFSLEEIAHAFLAKKETIKKRLHRARATLRNCHFQIHTLPEADIRFRLDTVLKTLYLLFNEGYFSKSHDQLIRHELCAEAIRLALVLAENPLTGTAQTKALLALMCYQSSRLDARTNDSGGFVVFDEQDRKLWDTQLIEKGNYYFVHACQGNAVSKYHLEAGIAYWHAHPAAQGKWQQILQLYNQLILIEYSPVTALNRAFAIGQVYGYEKAIREVEKLQLVDSDLYQKLLGYLYEGIDPARAIDHYTRAAGLTGSKALKLVLEKKIAQLRTRP